VRRVSTGARGTGARIASPTVNDVGSTKREAAAATVCDVRLGIDARRSAPSRRRYATDAGIEWSERILRSIPWDSRIERHDHASVADVLGHDGVVQRSVDRCRRSDVEAHPGVRAVAWR
jgi:hypothetical protein